MTFAGEFLGLPGLRGYWPMGAFDSSGNAIDQSGNARTLTYTGNPTFNYTTEGGPYCDYDGTGDYHSRADEAGLDFLGTEAYIATAARGLTIGGWFQIDTATAYGLMAKGDAAAASSSFELYLSNTAVTFRIVNAAAYTTVTLTTAISTATWYFVAGRFDPSTELKAYIKSSSSASDINTTSIPASIANSAAAFTIGALAGGVTPLNGRAGMCFTCAMLLSDTAIDNIYQNTKAFYGL